MDGPKDMEMPGSDRVSEKWTLGVNVVICLTFLIGVLAWRVFRLPSDDNGGGVLGAMVVSFIEFVRNLVVLEVVRRVFKWKVPGG
jgi:hypothetical protein